MFFLLINVVLNATRLIPGQDVISMLIPLSCSYSEIQLYITGPAELGGPGGPLAPPEFLRLSKVGLHKVLHTIKVL